MRHGLGRHRSHAEQQGPHSTQTVSVSLLIYSTRFPFAFFFLSSRFLRRRRVASIVAALPEGACGSMGAMPRTIPRIFWPAPESRPSDKCSGRRCSLAELWFPFDFFFLKKYLFIYPSREERQQLQVAYHRPRSTFFSSLLPSHIRLGLWFRDFPPLLFFVFFSPRRRFRPYKPTASTHNDGRQPRKSWIATGPPLRAPAVEQRHAAVVKSNKMLPIRKEKNGRKSKETNGRELYRWLSPSLFFYTIVRSRVCQEEEGGKRIRERKRLGGSRSGYG